MVIAHNMLAMNSQRMYGLTTSSKAKSTEKLSSGYKINRAADDAAGLTISEKMRSQIRGLNQGSNNIQDGISLIQIADGALSEVNEMLHRMTELSVKSANGTNTDADRNAIQQEINQLIQEIDKISKSTQFNTLPLFDDVDANHPDGITTDIVDCPALINGTASGYITETWQDPSGNWHAAGSMDFSNLSLETIDDLDGCGFKFTCSASCAEAFDITFSTTKPSTANNLDGQVTHTYTINVAGCTTGTEVIERTMDFLNKNKVSGSGSMSIPGALTASHSNGLIREGDKLIIFSTQTHNNEAGALAQGKGYSGAYGKVTCKNIDKKVHRQVAKFPIQCSNNKNDSITIATRRMNSKVLGVNKVDVSTESGAKDALAVINKANSIVSTHRSEYGAYQNRLEHSYDNNNNKAENTTAAESRIRDTDMAAEMVKLSTQNILQQAGEAMMAQANQSTQGVLSLLS